LSTGCPSHAREREGPFDRPEDGHRSHGTYSPVPGTMHDLFGSRLSIVLNRADS
jgi:hypothetical protein